ncbi:MAG: hypothetical protein LQ349_004522 [Xanthoria aureola]|nr:MAG: hypothetical protein LQ349_004522 [Xanthoria aureola]
MLAQGVGQSIPADTPHAVSVSLPTWRSCVGYEEGEEGILKKMNNGYPRFFIDKCVTSFAATLIERYGTLDEWAILLPSHAVAVRCASFLQQHLAALDPDAKTRTIDLLPRTDPENGNARGARRVSPMVSVAIYPKRHSALAKSFWQHTGEGVSSRRAELCHRAFNDGFLAPRTSDNQTDGSHGHSTSQKSMKGPLRYQKARLADGPEEHVRTRADSLEEERRSNTDDSVLFVEERYGRNLDLSRASQAKVAIRRRIAGALTADVDLNDMTDTGRTEIGIRQVSGFSEEDVYLYPSGMSSIFNTHRIMMASRGALKSICFGFPYIDTLKILEKWGPGCLFYGHGSAEDLDDLEKRCKGGEKYLALFCEFPGNPLLKCPDLARIRALADHFDFAVVVDETIGNFLNIHVMPHADVVVSSLTKVFSGDSNVMGGSSILNPRSRYYHLLKKTMETEYEDNYWAEDALFMERNSRDFVSRIARINVNAEAICNILQASKYGQYCVKEVYYPKYSPTRPFYEEYRSPTGGYGGLLSVTFRTSAEAIAFYDGLETAKGPSLGTNFTLTSPYTLLAHYNELAWAAKYGVDADLVRMSVGLEDTNELCSVIERALTAVGRVNET